MGKIGEFERRMISELKAREPSVLEGIRDSREMKPDVEKTLASFMDGFAKNFA